MASNLAPASTTQGSPAARRFGYLVAIVVNGIMIWVAHRLLDWQWPGFLTDDFDAVLWLLSASFVAGMVVNACFLLYDRGRFRAFGDLVTAAFGLAVTLRIWDVFPFEFSDYGTDWSWLFRAVLALGAFGTSVAILINVARLIRPADRPAG
jgi:hypothetical protein